MRHAKIRERKRRQEINRKRSLLVSQLDILYSQSCERCKDYQTKNTSYKCDCDAYIKIREIGRQLDKLLAPRKCESAELLGMINELDDITPQLYARLKYLKVPDRVFCEKLGIDNVKFRAWKEEQGYVNVHRKGAKA